MKKVMIIVQAVLMLFWGTQLINSNAIKENWLLLLFAAGICFAMNIKSGIAVSLKETDKRSGRLIVAFSVLLSCMVTFSNYEVWAFPNTPEANGGVFMLCYKALCFTAVLGGGLFVFYNILAAMAANVTSLIWKSETTESPGPVSIFFLSLVLITSARFIVLYFCNYPAILDPDSINQLTQIMTGSYSNHHSYFHTMMIKASMSIGYSLFGGINEAVATFSFLQSLFLAACFSFAVSTFKRMGVPRWIRILTLASYILLPQHFIYSIYMINDTPFAGFTLLFLLAFYRCMTKVGNALLNYVVMVLSAVGICLFRSNGFFAFVLTVISFVVIWGLKYKKVLFTLLGIIVVSFALKHTMLSIMNIPQPDIIESLSIPAQQVTRVVYEGYDITDEQRELIGDVIDIDHFHERYHIFESDPLKDMVREKGNQNVITKKPKEYLKLWASLGLRYPLVYIRSWIDETRGYWNAGYGFQYYQLGARINDMGIQTQVRSVWLYTVFYEYIWIFTDLSVLRLFISIGLCTWIDIILLMIALIRRNRLSVFVTLPLLFIVLSFAIAAPHFGIFRYLYVAYCVLPFAVAVVFRPACEEDGF